MKRLLMILTVVLVLAPASLWAQGAPAEVFGGLSFYHTPGVTPVGWQASLAGGVSPRFSLVGDFGGQYKDGASIYQFLGGARMTERMEKTSIFGHAMFGGARLGAAGLSSTNFAMAYGGGLDINATDRVDIRVIQFDWIPIKGDTAWENNSLRFGFGIVYKFGS
jgi:hypothetical protein